METSSLPLLSILIPTWNRVQPVLDAVESVAPLSDDIEIVIVDNASDSGIFEELQKKIETLPGVRLFRNERNLGMVKNWNRCLEFAQGKWFSLLCSDDQFQPGALQRFRNIAAEHPEPALIVQDPSQLGLTLSPAGSETVRNLKLPIASGNFWHRSVYEQIGGFDERFEYSADAEYWYRAAFSFPVIKVREPFAVYVPHENNYMWATWRRPDYLKQTELLSRTVAGYFYSESPDRNSLVEAKVADDIWQTLLSIIACTFLSQGKMDIFQRYFGIAVRQTGMFSRKLQLLKILVSVTVCRLQALLWKRGKNCHV